MYSKNDMNIYQYYSSRTTGIGNYCHVRFTPLDIVQKSTLAINENVNISKFPKIIAFKKHLR